MNIVFQIFINSIISGLLLSLISIGFTYIFNVTKVFHLAHGAIFILGAYTFLFTINFTNSWTISFLLMISIVSIIIIIIEKFIYLPLYNEKSNDSISLIASMGIYIVIVNLIAMVFGNDNKTINIEINSIYHIQDLIITKIQLIQFLVAIIVIVLLFFLLKYTKMDLSLKAISDNEQISNALGINVINKRLMTLILGSILAGIAGMLTTIEFGVEPHAGLEVTLTAVVVAILVTRTNILLIVFFSILLTILQNTIEWFFNAQWRELITYLILLLVILYKTEGLLSYNLRTDK